MQKKITIYFFLILCVIVGSSSVKNIYNSGAAPTGRTGTSPTNTCASAGCHSSSAVNAGGGSITVSGLPTANYVAGQAYPFSLTITHPSSRGRWGFAIKAVNAANVNAAIGTFSTTNPNARVASNELGHDDAVFSTGTSFTFNNLTWTAPPSTSAPASVRFFYTGNAADGTGGTGGDFIYTANSTSDLLPIILTQFSVEINSNTNVLTWRVENNKEVKYFEVLKSSDNENFNILTIVNASSLSVAAKYTYKDDKTNGTSYYKLKMIDKNGLINYSKTISSKSSNGDEKLISTYPNPLKKGQQMNVEMMSNKNQEASFTLVNLQGKIISSKIKDLTQGYNRIALQFGNFIAAGNYYLTVKVGNELLQPLSVTITE
jgi:hypothetical protein